MALLEHVPDQEYNLEVSPLHGVDSPGLTESVSGSSFTEDKGKRKRRRREEQQERWISNLEQSNIALSKSVEVLTKAATGGEEREKAMGGQLEVLKEKLLEYEHQITKLEQAVLSQREELNAARYHASTTTLGDSETARENIELKENIKALAQLVLSSPTDVRTTKLLQVLTAPVGGLSAVGSRSGVIGLESTMGGQRESATPLALMGAAVAGPVPETPSMSGTSVSEMLQSQSSVGSKRSSFKVDFGFSFGNKKRAPTLFGLCIGVCMTSFLPLEPPLPSHPAPHHAARKLLSHQPPTPPTIYLTLSILSVVLLSVLLSNYAASYFTTPRDEPLLPQSKEHDAE